MDKVLQIGLSAGMSSTAGIHSNQPNWTSRADDGKNTKPPSFCPNTRARIAFPAVKEPVQASYVCVGAWSWGDKVTWNWSDEEFATVQDAWRALYDAGINFIDTADTYGRGISEELVGRLVKGLPRSSFVIQTKYTGTPMGISNYIHPVDAPVRSLRKSLERLGLQYVDIYLVHGPIHPQSIANVAKGMAKCVDEGMARAVGVANYQPDDLQKMRDALVEHSVPLATNQCEFSILRRYPELHNGIAACERNGIVFQGYSTLAQGRLSDKYSIVNPPPPTRRFSNYPMKDIENTLQVLRRIGRDRGRNVASVAINYSISKGALPVVGIRNPAQAQDMIDALGWRLTDTEMVELDRVSIEGKRTAPWQQG